MNNNSFDLKLDDGVKNIFSDIDKIQNQINNIENLIANVRKLCVQLRSYDHSLLDYTDFIYDFTDNFINQVYCWLIVGDDKLDEAMDSVELDIEQVRSRVLNISKSIVNLDNVVNGNTRYANKIADIFTGGSVTGPFNDDTIGVK